jgi:hypothetical protein
MRNNAKTLIKEARALPPQDRIELLEHVLDNGDILALAVARLHRRPDYWRDRLKR